MPNSGILKALLSLSRCNPRILTTCVVRHHCDNLSILSQRGYRLFQVLCGSSTVLKTPLFCTKPPSCMVTILRNSPRCYSAPFKSPVLRQMKILVWHPVPWGKRSVECSPFGLRFIGYWFPRVGHFCYCECPNFLVHLYHEIMIYRFGEMALSNSAIEAYCSINLPLL